MARPRRRALSAALLCALVALAAAGASSTRGSRRAPLIAPLLSTSKPVTTYAFVSPHEVAVAFGVSGNALRYDLNAPNRRPPRFPVPVAYEEHAFAAGSPLFTSPSFAKSIAQRNGTWYLFDRKGRVVKPCPPAGLDCVWMQDESGWYDVTWNQGQGKTFVRAHSLRHPDRGRLVASLPGWWELLGQSRPGHIVCVHSSTHRLADCELRTGRITPIRCWTPSRLSFIGGRLLSPDGKRIAWLVVPPTRSARGPLECQLYVATLGSVSMKRLVTLPLPQGMFTCLYSSDGWPGPLFMQWRPDSRAIAWVRSGRLELVRAD